MANGLGPEVVGTKSKRPGGRIMFVVALFLVLAVVAVGVALAGGWATWSELEVSTGAPSWRPRPTWLALSLGCAVVALLITGRMWAALFRSAGGRTGGREATAAWLGSNLGRYLPGKIWQLTSLAAYVRARGDSGATAFAISLSLQAIILATGAGVAVAALGTGAFGDANAWTLALAGIAILAALNPTLLKHAVRLGARLLGEEPGTADAPLSPGAMVAAGVGGLLVWGLYGIGFWALLEGLVAENTIAIPVAGGIFAAGYVIGYLVLLAPGGIIVREGAIAALLGAVAGIPLGPAAAVALAARLWTTAAELLAFGVAAGFGLRRGPGGR